MLLFHDTKCAMTNEYVAVIAEDDYHAFKILITTTLPRDFGMWLRVREVPSGSWLELKVA
jgi:hypothetical protein